MKKGAYVAISREESKNMAKDFISEYGQYLPYSGTVHEMVAHIQSMPDEPTADEELRMLVALCQWRVWISNDLYDILYKDDLYLALAELPEITWEEIEKLLPKSVYLVSTPDSRLEATSPAIEALLSGKTNIFNEAFDEQFMGYIWDLTWESTGHLINELEEDLRRADFTERQITLAMREYADEIRETLEERDTSDPLGRILRNTPDEAAYVELDYEINSSADPLEEASTLMGLLPIDDREVLEELIADSQGGMLRIYFLADLEEFYKAESEFIQFNGRIALAIVNHWNGSGNHIYAELTEPIKMNRSGIKHCRVHSYSYTHEIAYINNDWWADTQYKLID